MEPKRMGARDARDNLPSRIDAAHFRHEPTIITRNGEPRAVLISYAEWERLLRVGERGGGDVTSCAVPVADGDSTPVT